MSLVNAVHALLEVAAGRLNLTPQAADELHAAIDAEQTPVQQTMLQDLQSPAQDPDPAPPAPPVEPFNAPQGFGV